MSKSDYRNIIEATPRSNYELFVKFDDGTSKIIDIKPLIKDGVSSKLANKDIFESVKIENGYLVWSNGYDLCPNSLYEM